MESTPIVKKTKAPKIKKTFAEPVNIEIVDVNALQTQVVNDLIEELKQELPTTKPKQDVILGIDPAHIKCGYSILDSKTGKYINSWTVPLRPSKKLIQSEVDGYVCNSVKKIIKDITDQYNITHAVIELQLGQFSCTSIQLAFVMALPDDVKYTIQHSKLKLKHDDTKKIDVPNPDSKQYNQNKQVARELCYRLFSETRSRECGFDEVDSVLHSLYAFNNMNTIKWIIKKDLQ